MDQLPPEQTFFAVGGTLALDAPSYLARKADSELTQCLLEGDYCYLLNSRQMGKSSLCVRAKQTLEAKGIRVAFLDLTKFGGRNITAEQWYVSLLAEISRAIGRRTEALAAFKSGDGGPMRRFFDALESACIDEPLCILVDEIDVTRSLPFDTDEFFAGVRECFNRRVQEPRLQNLTFALIGVATPSELVRDARTTPFNIGRRIELRDFTESEAMPLASGLGMGGEKKLRRILHWTGGHPYLTQAVCAEAVAHPSESIDAIVNRMFFTAKARETNVNLADVQNRMLSVPPEGVSLEEHRAAILDLYAQVRSRRKSVKDDETGPLVALLKLCGLTRVIDGYLWIRNRIYFRVFDQAWVRAQMPNAELERQRRVARAATWKALGYSGIGIATLSILLLDRHLLAGKNEQLASAMARERNSALVARASAEESFKKEAISAKRAAIQEAIALAKSNQAAAKSKQAEENLALAKLALQRESAAKRTQLQLRKAAVNYGHIAERRKLFAEDLAYDSTIALMSNLLKQGKTIQARSLLARASAYPRKGLEYAYYTDVLSQFESMPVKRTLTFRESDSFSNLWRQQATWGMGGKVCAFNGSLSGAVSTQPERLVFGTSPKSLSESYVDLCLANQSNRWAAAVVTDRSEIADAPTGRKELPSPRKVRLCSGPDYRSSSSPISAPLIVSGTWLDQRVIEEEKSQTGLQLDIERSCISPSGRFYAVVGSIVKKGSIKLSFAKIFDCMEGTEVYAFDPGQHVNDVCFVGDEKLVALNAFGEMHVISLRGVPRQATVEVQSSGVGKIAWVPGSRCILMLKTSGCVERWDLDSGNSEVLISWPGIMFTSLSVSESGKYIAVGDGLNRIHVFRDTPSMGAIPGENFAMTSYGLLRSYYLPVEGAACVFISEEERSLYLLDDGVVRFPSQQAIGRLSARVYRAALRSAVDELPESSTSTDNTIWISPSARFYLEPEVTDSGYNGSITVSDRFLGRKFRLVGHTPSVSGVAFNRSEDRLLTCSSDSTIRLWSLRTGTELVVLPALAERVKFASTEVGFEWSNSYSRTRYRLRVNPRRLVRKPRREILPANATRSR